MTNAMPAVHEPAVPASVARAEAARYALLRRLAPSMRHHLVVNLQPIGMIYEVMDRRLRAPSPDLASIHEGAHKINGFARAASDKQQPVLGHRLRHPREEVARQVGRGAVRLVGEGVAAVEEVPVCVADLRPA